jgi:hypothetical protein
MKRNFFIAIAVTALMVASTIAQAADITFSGQIRPRFIMDEDATDTTNLTGATDLDTDKAFVFDTRVRLNAKANVNANTEVFLQLQSVGNWGVDGANTGTRQSQGGAAGQSSDTLADVGFHQAYLTLKNFGGKAVDAKIGRQEVVLDGHRLFGNTGWTTGAETKDAIRLTHSGGNHTINAIYIAETNSDAVDDDVNQNGHMYVLHTNTQGVLGGALSGYFVYLNDSSADAEVSSEQNWFTIGARQAGKLGSLDYRVEYYHQFGDGAAAANAVAGYGTAVTNSSDIDRDAHMFGIRVGKTLANVAGKPSLTLWYDRLSGTDDEDVTDSDFGGFDTLSDTGHKFYGFQDFYLSSTGGGTRGLGLQDIAIKTKISPAAGWTAKADMHWFHTAVDASGDDADTFVTSDGLINGVLETDLGSELDLTLAHKYDANTKIVLGYSHYWTSATFGQLNAAGGQALTLLTNSARNADSEWATPVAKPEVHVERVVTLVNQSL